MFQSHFSLPHVRTPARNASCDTVWDEGELSMRICSTASPAATLHQSVSQAGLRTHEQGGFPWLTPSHAGAQWHVSDLYSFTVAGAVPG
jgi:hypothetical protein